MRWVMAAAAAMCFSGAASAMMLSSADFKDGAALPAMHIYPRCGGQNVSPELSWSGAPAGTKSFVLTMIDVSVKPNGWSHWIVTGLPPSAISLAHGTKALPAPAKAQSSNFGDLFYDGPCPPPGTGTHRYEFTIWAMPSANTAIAPDAKATDVTAALTRSALEHATIAASVSAR